MLRDLPDDDDWIRARQQAIGERIQAQRLRQNLTQEAVYLAADVHRGTLQALEAGRANPTIETLLRLAHVLDVPLSDLLR
ncbi:helix-turn-helix transcriptional regulator [Streptomyces europaeiscabiei]|uniref:helix-turn-helix domain-containing protein n=1 Tax=Streptomyces europaeiscabiei TaxID=146819 RepID=UPI0029BC577E|nr:helix-turn-helix transcriptional regulator [Streptomyces europaeiscabiei]MDX3629065.1 helix-turn-helix transcriptional regulator [Streptomyces europaeiscabiei]MDX3647317.1 helix-turn-helix transcriptional regulator [Streptomyces europaeiscabiei]